MPEEPQFNIWLMLKEVIAELEVVLTQAQLILREIEKKMEE